MTQGTGIARRRIAAWALLVATVAAGGCTALPESRPRETLNERTGATLTVAAKPLVLARDRADLAAHARDYATLTAVEENNGGRRRLYLVADFWSTADSRLGEVAERPARAATLLADGQRLAFAPLQPVPASVSFRSGSVPAPASRAFRSVYAVDEATLDFVAASRELTLHVDGSSFPEPYLVWEDGRPALRRFVAHLHGR